MLGVNYGSVDDTTLVKRSIVVYAVYRATNHLRHAPLSSTDAVKDMLCQFAREAVRGHGPATKRLEIRADDS